MEKTIAMLPGEGIGSEVLAQAEKVLRSIGTRFGHRFTFVQVGGGLSGPLTEEQLSSCLAADSVLAGVGVGRGISQLSQELNLKANMRPALLYPQLAGASPLAPALVKQDIDLMLVQALAGIRALEWCGVPRGETLLVTYPPLVNVFSRNALEQAGVTARFILRPSRDALLVALCEGSRFVVGESSFLRATLQDARRMGLSAHFFLLFPPETSKIVLKQGPAAQAERRRRI